MGRRKIDRSHLKMQSFEMSKPLKARLEEKAKSKGITVSALIREILELYFEERL